MTGTIVVGVDGNERAERAAETAARLAAATGAALHVVCAYSREQSAEVEAGGERLTVSVSEESADIAARTAARLAGLVGAGGAVTSAAVQARPADALLAEAERLDATLVVVGNRRMQGIARVLGSVPAAVAHHAQCDVYIVNTA
ncbi:universal stress protein [Nocardioides sp. L-11A]|uniref:universal stress protein n=1 Tax=Nocardioides sp. L-11A TaxID=3043848 RepID=UPI00249BE8E2|nr:universal stress protein [Nocardioides sp. L-11A]